MIKIGSFRDWLMETEFQFGKYIGIDHTKVPDWNLQWYLTNVGANRNFTREFRREIEEYLKAKGLPTRLPPEPKPEGERRKIVVKPPPGRTPPPQPEPPPAPAPAPEPANVGQKTPRWWILAKVIAPHADLAPGQFLAMARRVDGSYHYVSITGPETSGDLAPNELKGVVQSIKTSEGKPVEGSSPEELLAHVPKEAPKSPMEKKAQGHILSREKMSEEQKMIDAQFEKIMNDPGQSHIMINALAGTGKTTMLKHLAWKYGKKGEKWLYLVFNKKNREEANEKFPIKEKGGGGGWVEVATTNSFLGHLLESDENMGKIPRTERTVKLGQDDNRKKKGDDKISKIGILAESPEFSQFMAQLGLPEPGAAVEKVETLRSHPDDDKRTKENNDKTKKTLASLIRDMRYTFKEQVLKLAGLAKSYSLDPRKSDQIEAGIREIAGKYDFEWSLESVKKRIEDYNSYSFQAKITSYLDEALGYEFMTKNYKNEIIQAALLMLKDTMPQASNHIHVKDGVKYKMGHFRDFDDDLWYAAIHADQIHWPHFDYILADEVQDFNEAQKVMLKKLHEAGAKIVAVGDPNQCHPPGTMIALTGGVEKPIEQILPGDEVVSYNTKKSYFPGTASQGRKVLEVASRPYEGELINIQTLSNTQKCTPNHRCLVKFGVTNKYCLYLMTKGGNARLGICRLNYKDKFGIVGRACQERADRAWLLDVYDTEREARIQEVVVAASFGLPQVIFCNNGQKKTASQEVLNEIYHQIGNNLHKAEKCLQHFGRSVEHPLWSKEQHERFGTLRQNYIGSKKSFITQACNLVSGVMQVRTFDGTPRGGKWENISVSREKTSCQVYSLKVEATEGGRRLYVADGIVTHNSIYRFRGADAGAFNNIANQLSDLSQDKNVVHTLSKNYRSRKAIIDYANANTVVNNLQQGKVFNDGDEGEVTEDEIEYGDAFDIVGRQRKLKGSQMRQTAFIARTNEPLVEASLRLLAQGVPFVIVGKDVGKDLLNHIDGIMRKMNIKDTDSVATLGEKLEQNRSEQQEKHSGKVTQTEYLRALSDTTNALISSIQSFDPVDHDDEYRPRSRYGYNPPPKPRKKVGEFREWLKKQLGGLDVDDNEKDLAEYKRMMEELNPVVLTTAHRSKGLEFSRVFILRNDLFPHPKNKKREEDLVQEENARYVAYTRAMDELHIVKLKGQPGYKEPGGGNRM